MSTAVMPSSTSFEFGDLYFKNAGGSITANMLKVRWSPDSSRAVGSPVQPSSNNNINAGGPQPLSRRNSTPPQQQSLCRPSAFALQSIALETALNNNNNSVTNSNSNGHRRLDRCHSEPVERNSIAAIAAAAACGNKPGCTAAAANINTSRYKTELCRPFEESGTCKYGDKCQFAHGAHELRNLVRHPKYKTELCRTFHTIGFCPYGPRCHFIHNAEEARVRTIPALAPGPQVQPGMMMSHSQGRVKPLPLGGSAFNLHCGSTGDSPSPPCSLSESPTSSLGSFFSEPDLLFPSTPFTPHHQSNNNSSSNSAFTFGQDFISPLMQIGAELAKSPSRRSLVELETVREASSMPSELSSPGSMQSISPRDDSPPSSPLEPGRLPVFNKLSRTLMG